MQKCSGCGEQRTCNARGFCEACVDKALVTKPCDHPAIEDLGGGKLKCRSCGKTWTWNPLLHYFSDSFVGVFVKTPDHK